MEQNLSFALGEHVETRLNQFANNKAKRINHVPESKIIK